LAPDHVHISVLDCTTRWMSGAELVGHLELGDLVEFSREFVTPNQPIYAHWAVVVQRDNHIAYVCHIWTDDDEFDGVSGSTLKTKLNSRHRAEVRCDDLMDVCRESRCRVNNSADRQLNAYPPNDIVERAVFQLGARNYNILWSNCEHFVKWCRYGSKRSDQATLIKSCLIGATALVVSNFSLVAGISTAAIGYGTFHLANRVYHRMHRNLPWN